MALSKTRLHYTEPYILNPQHRITVDLIGLGGTGSRVLSALGDINVMLVNLDHPGLYVRAWDPDVISVPNIGRQAFSAAEVGQYKATSIVGKVNRHFGTDWEACPVRYAWTAADEKAGHRKTSNIVISCVDSIAARYEIGELVSNPIRKGRYGDDVSTSQPYYWLDFGNAQRTGQAVLGTLKMIPQPHKLPKGVEAVATLPTVLQQFPDLRDQPEDESGPSCSHAEALSKQDLFINRALSDFGLQILWNLFKDLRIQHRGAYVNLATLTTNPINV